jgi:hypothetical protein
MTDPILQDEFVYSNKNPTIFLDIDGVLNTHTRFPNSYSTIEQPQVRQLNQIFAHVDNLQLVISSAWRYLILTDNMSVQGFECMLLTYGINCANRVVGHTRKDYKWDNDEISIADRADQITEFVQLHNIENYIVLDDLPLPLSDRFIQTQPDKGLTQKEAIKAIKILCSVK